LNERRPQHIISKITAEFVGSPQIDFVAAEDRRQLAFHTCHAKVTHPFAGLKLNEHVDIAGIGKATR
jgi:hypothetical protein